MNYISYRDDGGPFKGTTLEEQLDYEEEIVRQAARDDLQEKYEKAYLI